jgi:bacillolysin
MKKLILLISFQIIGMLCFSQEKIQNTIIIKDKNGIIESVQFSEKDKNYDIPESSKVFFDKWLNISSNDLFRAIPHKSKNKEYIHEHFDQYYDGIRVEDAGYNFHYKNGKMFFAHGHYVSIKNLNITPLLSSKEVLESFRKYEKIQNDSIADFSNELIIKEIDNSNKTTQLSIPKLVYKVYLRSKNNSISDIGFIDAMTGEILQIESTRLEINGIGSFATRYNGTQYGNTHYYGGNWHLVDSIRGAVIHTWKLWGWTPYDKIELSDNDNNWTNAEHASSEDDMGLDVFWGLQQINNRLYFNHGINSYDDNGYPVNAYIHYGFTDTEKDNAFWDLYYHAMFFGDGAVKYSPIACIDAIAHEFGHGITQFQIGWPYTGDRAVFHEGLSDIWGTIMEYRIIYPNSIWKIGEQIILNYDCLRNIENTHDQNSYYNMANTYLSNYYNNNSGVYQRSGVFSHWFYLLVNGGEGVNEINNSYKVYGVGMDMAENLIVEAVFNNYLNNTTTFSQLRTAFKNAALALCSSQNSLLSQQVENAWYAVGVGDNPGQAEISGPSYVCPNGTAFSVSNVPAGASITWSQSGNINRISAQGSNPCTFASSYSGTGSIEATITNGCETATLPSKTIWAGVPDPDMLDLGSTIAPGGHALYYGDNILVVSNGLGTQGMDEYIWDMDFNYSNFTESGNAVEVYDVYDINGNDHTSISIKAHNTCGWSDFSSGIDFTIYSEYFMSISPNPTTNETTIAIESSSKDSKVNVNEGWDLEIYSSDMLLKEKEGKLKSNEYKLNTANWKEGVYILKAKYKDKVLQGKLVVKK